MIVTPTPQAPSAARASSSGAPAASERASANAATAPGSPARASASPCSISTDRRARAARLPAIQLERLQGVARVWAAAAS